MGKMDLDKASGVREISKEGVLIIRVSGAGLDWSDSCGDGEKDTVKEP